jgi:hypothetical protein
MNESLFISPDDSASKKDIMSLLVRARANEEKAKPGLQKGPMTNTDDYRMSDEEMVEQVVGLTRLFRAW